MRINLKKRFTALMLAGMMVTSNVLPAYSATDGIAVEQADASYEGQTADSDASADAGNSEAGGASSEQDDSGKPVADAVDSDSTTDASANAGDESHVAGAAAGSASSTSASDNAGAGSAVAGEQTTANKSEATSGTVTEETKSDAANGTATEETKSDAANGTVAEESKADAANGTTTEESKSDAANGTVTEESKSDATHGTGAEESKADAGHGSNAGGSTVVGAGSVGIDESTGAAVEIEETKPAELLEEETKLATESEIPKEEDEKKLEEKENRKTIYIAFGKGVKVTATLEDANAVPDDARLRVTEIDDDEMYAAYLEAMDEAEPEIEHTKDNTVLRDISFIMKDEDGEETEYEPTEGSVKITIEYLENHLQDWFGVEDAAEVKTYHLPLAEGVKAEGEKTIDVQNVKASDINVQELDSDVKTEKTVEVEVDSFSMFAMRAMRSAGGMSNTSSDLSRFLTGVEIEDITQNEDGSYTIRPNSNYKFKLHFEEENWHGGLQFDNSELKYTMPEGLKDLSTDGKCKITFKKSGKEYDIYDNAWKIENGVLTFHWNENDSNFSLLKDASNTEFYIELTGKVKENVTELKWSDDVNIQLDIDTKNYVKVKKECNNLDLENKKITYVITVKSSGNNKNVVVTDTITGTALTYNQDAVVSDKNWNKVTTAEVTTQENGFICRIPEMQNDETLYIKYSAAIDPNKITGNGLKGETENKVSGTSDGQDKPSTDTLDFKNKIEYSPKLRKEAKDPGNVDKNGYRIIPYTITYNENRLVSAKGHKVTDEIAKNSQTYMNYDGNVTIKVYKKNGDTTPSETRTLELKDGVKTWTYTIPEGDEEPYKYVFEYNAKVYVNNLENKITVKNTVKDETTGKDSSVSKDVQPNDEIKPGIKKDVISYDTSEIKWKITLTVPANGLSGKTVVTDTLPIVRDLWYRSDGNGAHIEKGIDTYKSLNIQNDKNDSYSIDLSDPEKVVITFPDGLEGTGQKRTIEITLITNVNQEWLKAVASNRIDADAHENKVKLTLNSGKTFEDSAKAYPSYPTIRKNSKGKIEEKDGSPIYKFEVMLGGVTEKTFEVRDDFPEYFKYFDDQKHKAKVFGGSTYTQQNGDIGKVQVEKDNTKNSVTFHVSLNEDAQKYDYYKIEYYLSVKDLEALHKLQEKAFKEENNTCRLTNTAYFNNATGSASFDYTYDVLDKKLLSEKDEIKKSHIAEFKITVNPGALKIHNGEPYDLTDEFKNLSIDTASINVTTNPEANIEYNISGNTCTFYNIPDQTAVEISYRARVIGEKQVKISNTASITGDSETVDEDVYIASDSGGTASSISLNLMKYEKDHTSSKLKGAIFALHVIDQKGADHLLQEFTTGDDGLVTMEGSAEKGWTFNTNDKYYLQEITAPDGYKLDNTKYEFKISETPDPDHHVYCPGDTINIPNEKKSETPESGSLEFTKSITGYKVKPADEEKITFTVAGPDYSKIIKLSEMKQGDGTYKATLTDLKPGEYTITESENRISGYDRKVTYKVGDKTTENASATVNVAAGATPSTATITNTYTQQLGSLEFTKSITGYEVKPADEEAITFTVAGPDYSKIIKLSEMKQGDGTYKATLTDLKPGEYTIAESENRISGYDRKVTYTVGGTTTEGASATVSVVAKEKTVAIITNTYDVNEHPVVISKTNAGGSELEGAVLELTDGTGALVDKWTSTTTARTFELKPGTYKFHEVSAPSGYLVADDITFTVTIDGTITVDGKTVDKVVMIDRKKSETTVPETTPVETTPEETTVPETTPTETTVPETTPAETTTPSGGGGGGGGEHPHPLPETTPVETTPAETTVPETTPVETTTPGGGNGGPSEEVETDEYGRVRGANRGKNKNGQDGGRVQGRNRGKTRTGDESMMSIFGFGFLAAVLVLLGWFGIRFTKRNRR